MKNSTLVAADPGGGALAARFALGRRERGDHLALEASRRPSVLEQRIEHGGQLGVPAVPAADIGVAHPPSSRVTVQRVTVISPRLKRAPVPPARPRTITIPISGARTIR